MSSIESRGGVRVKIDATVMLQIDKAMRAQVHVLREPKKALVVDISVVGLGIIAPVFLPRGAALETMMDGTSFGTANPTRILGEIRYCRPAEKGKYRVGVKFVDIESGILSKIKDYVAKNKH